MSNRYIDWLKQADADLRHAKNALYDKDFEWSCFSSQQAAEKAIKAVFLKNSMDAWGHTLTILLGNLQSELIKLNIDNRLINCAKVLDKHYIPTRYPNGFDSGAPTDFYTEEEANKALECANEIIEFCKDKIRIS